MPTCGSPGLFAAYRVLRRQSVPWHPPCALFRLICLRAPALPPLSRPLRFSRSDTSTFLRLLRSVRISFFGLRSALPTGFLPRFPSTSFGFFFPCAVFKVRLRLPPSLPVCLSLPLPFPLPAAFEVSLFSDPSKRYSEEFPSDASPLSLRWLYIGLTVFRLAASRSVPQSWVPQSPAGLSGSPGSLPLSGSRLLASTPRFDLGCE